MTGRHLLAGAGMIAAAWLAFTVGRDSGAAPPPTRHQTPAAAAAPADSPRGPIVRTPVSRPAAPPPIDTPTETEEPPPEPVPLEVAAARLTDLHAAEPLDRAWADDAGRTLRAALEERMPAGSSLRSLDCRQTLCRAEIGHTAPTGHQDFFAQAMGLWNGPTLVQPEGSAATVVIVAAADSDPLGALVGAP